ncbi:hypothetical protein [Nioella sp.]|jgi:hypothetical protein|uniref:hypothetical protein n=1 Tax=Nioella sp. TaxID=1912091 RepID=UPI003B526181
MPLSLPLDTLILIAGSLGVHTALSILSTMKAEAMTGLSGPHRREVFCGAGQQL